MSFQIAATHYSVARSFVKASALILLVCCVAACDSKSPNSAASGVSLHTGLGGDASGYKRACGPREFYFPQDHADHPEYRNEWWYITGNLENVSAQRFGFHVTFFRIANSPLAAGDLTNKVTSAWASNEFYMAHFAITSAADEKIIYFERFGRAAAGLSGVEVSELVEKKTNTRVWLDDWQLNITETEDGTGLILSLTQDDSSLELSMVPEKPKVLQGTDGYSQKSADPCNASYYYALTRLAADGNLVFDSAAHTVSGSAWLDREWSSSALADNQEGWDWFALQLDDGRDIMLYQLRKQGGGIDGFSHAVEINPDGAKRVLAINEWSIHVDDWWESESGARYPVAGKIHIAKSTESNETIVFQPLLKDQELNLTVRYWEGAIILNDDSGREIGRGYMELTGY